MSQLSEDQTSLVHIASLDYLHLAVISIGEVWLVTFFFSFLEAYCEAFAHFMVLYPTGHLPQLKERFNMWSDESGRWRFFFCLPGLLSPDCILDLYHFI